MASSDGFAFFGLRLGSTSWKIAAGTGLGEWLRQFARILELDEWRTDRELTRGTEMRTLVILPQGHPGLSMPSMALKADGLPDLPLSDWRLTRVHQLRWWRHAQAPADILEIPVDGSDDERFQLISQACFPLYVRLVGRGGFPLHAALIERGGSAVALAAPGGTGKSTCSRRIPPPWRAVADDLTLVIAGGEAPPDVSAHAFPTWSEYLWKRSEPSWKAGTAWPLRAVFFLSRTHEDKVLPLGRGEAAINLSSSAHQILSGLLGSLPQPERRALRLRVFDNACRLAKSLPVYLLEVSLDGEFWREMERVL